MIRLVLVQNRQGKSRLSKFYVPFEDEEQVKIKGEIHRLIAPRDQKYQSNFVEVRRSMRQKGQSQVSLADISSL